jgi:hypothetical protein
MQQKLRSYDVLLDMNVFTTTCVTQSADIS